MKINFLEEKKGKAVFELEGVSHTLCNILKKELWKNNHIKEAGYTIRHPLIGRPEFIVETDGEDPRKVIVSTCQKLQKEFEKFGEEIKKEVK